MEKSVSGRLTAPAMNRKKGMVVHMPEHGTKARGSRAWIELDREALAHNVAVLRARLPESCRMMPAVKANAYGHGAVLMARELGRLGVDAFCVACVQEGAELRQNGIGGEILVLGYTPPEDFALLEKYRLTQTVADYSHAAALNRYGKKLHVHVAVDTGMHRLGESDQNTDRLCEILRMENLLVDGLFTHLCAADTSDPKDRAFTKEQAERFYRAVNAVKRKVPAAEECGSGLKLHLLASYGIFQYPEYAEDYARAGIALYGVPSTKEGCAGMETLRPVLSLKARVASVKELFPGECAGYGRAFCADRKRRLAVLTIGYADGLPRSLSNGVGAVLIRGKRAPVAGRICMDQTIVDVSDIPKVRAGDTAVVIGRSGAEEITACDLAQQSGTITNEILSRLGGRLERCFACG